MSRHTGNKFDYVSFLASGPTGVATAGKSYYASQLLGANNAYMTSQINGEDSKVSLTGSIAGMALGYGVGGAVTKKLESEYVKKYFGIKSSSNALKYTESNFNSVF